jgi:hypothetical protein
MVGRNARVSIGESGVSLVNLLFRFVQVSPFKSIPLRFAALPQPIVDLPGTGEFFTDSAYSLVCRSIIAYLTTVRYGRRWPCRIRIPSCGVLISKLTPK